MVSDERIEEFLKEYYYDVLLELDKSESQSIVIDFSILDRFDSTIAEELIEFPNTVFESFTNALNSLDLPNNTVQYVRIKNLPESKDVRIKDLRSKHLGKLLRLDCLIKSVTEVKPQIDEVTYQCPACNTLITVKQTDNMLKKPVACECGFRGIFKKVEQKLHDVRWLVASEPFEITEGEQPGEIRIFLKDDLTTPKFQRRTDPGSRLKITGVLKEIQRKIRGKASTRLDIYLDANYIEMAEIEYMDLEISDEDEKAIKELASDKNIYDKLIDSIAPGIYGYREIKEAIVLQLFGGVLFKMPDGTKIRGNIHILITGDPGVGKSQLIKLVSQIAPRGRYVSGKGVTGAGITATVRRDETTGTWVLEAGALVLSNRSIIGIDEFDKINRDDLIAMHEAMSIGTVSIAKASIIASLPAATAILAGANPKFGRFDRYKSIAEQINIPETLLSRFDLKFALLDMPNREFDEKITQHIISARRNAEVVTPLIDATMLRKYLAYAKSKISKIELTQEAAETLKNFYVEMRNKYVGEDVVTIPITLRQYEALIRLSEASAKVRLSNKVEIQDAERAIKLMKYSMSQLGYDPETGRYDIDRMDSSVSSSQRSKIKIILDIISRLQEESGSEVSREDIQAEAQNIGIDENEFDRVLEKLQNEGMIFYPRPNYIRKL